MISDVAKTWIPPSTMNVLAWRATARVVVSSDAISHVVNAGRLMPPEQRALIRREICGM
jgi:hypothetical protein